MEAFKNGNARITHTHTHTSVRGVVNSDAHHRCPNTGKNKKREDASGKLCVCVWVGWWRHIGHHRMDGCRMEISKRQSAALRLAHVLACSLSLPLPRVPTDARPFYAYGGEGCKTKGEGVEQTLGESQRATVACHDTPTPTQTHRHTDKHTHALKHKRMYTPLHSHHNKKT